MCVVDAMPQHAKPGENPIIFSDMRRQLLVDRLEPHQLKMFALKLLSDCLGAIVEAQHHIGASDRTRLQAGELLDQTGVVVGFMRARLVTAQRCRSHYDRQQTLQEPVVHAIARQLANDRGLDSAEHRCRKVSIKNDPRRTRSTR